MNKLFQLLFLALLISGTNCFGESYIVIKGKVTDQNKNPLPYSHVSIKNKPIGTTSNNQGEFILNISDIHISDTLIVSFIGHSTFEIDVKSCNNKILDIVLQKQFIELAEITVKPPSPTDIIAEAIEKIPENYWSEPIVLRTFYREFIKENDNYTEYAEGIIDIYKIPFVSGVKEQNKDELKLIKGRRKNDLNDYEIMKSAVVTIGGPVNCNYYDRMKYHNLFLRKNSFHFYDYELTTVR